MSVSRKENGIIVTCDSCGESIFLNDIRDDAPGEWMFIYRSSLLSHTSKSAHLCPSCHNKLKGDERYGLVI